MSVQPVDIVTLLIALGAGALIGLERRLHGHEAGIHTHALVSLGAALFVLLGAGVAGAGEQTRIASQITTGVGFLCAGVIMRDGLRIRGLNTAATVWCSSAVGSVAGLARWDLALAGAVIVTAANYLLHLVEHRLPWLSPAERAHENDRP